MLVAVTSCLSYMGRTTTAEEIVEVTFAFAPLKVFDASTNKWNLVDEKQRTDVYERNTEHQVDDDLQYRRNITDETNIINNLERNMLQEKFDEKHTRTTDSVDYIRSDHLIDESRSTSDMVNQVVIKEDVTSRKDSKVGVVILAGYSPQR